MSPSTTSYLACVRLIVPKGSSEGKIISVVALLTPRIGGSSTKEGSKPVSKFLPLSPISSTESRRMEKRSSNSAMSSFTIAMVMLPATLPSGMIASETIETKCLLVSVYTLCGI